MNDDFTDSFLTETEREALAQVVGSELVMGALQKVVLADVYFKGTFRKGIKPDPTRNAAYALAFTQSTVSNEVLGADLRAQAEGIRLVEAGFTRLRKLKIVEAKKEGKPENRAR